MHPHTHTHTHLTNTIHIVSIVHVLFVVQVIVEKVPKSSIQDIDKKKFLVPADLSGK